MGVGCPVAASFCHALAPGDRGWSMMIAMCRASIRPVSVRVPPKSSEALSCFLAPSLFLWGVGLVWGQRGRSRISDSPVRVRVGGLSRDEFLDTIRSIQTFFRPYRSCVSRRAFLQIHDLFGCPVRPSFTSQLSCIQPLSSYQRVFSGA